MARATKLARPRISTAPRLLALVLSLLALAVGLDLGLRNLSTSSVTCQSVLASGDGRPVTGCQVYESTDVLVYLPGVVARATSASAPVIDTWRQVGDVQLVDYIGARFDARATAHAVAEILLWDAQHYNHIRIYAESLGCFVAVDALSDARQRGTSLNGRLRVILGDCPSGPSTIKPDSLLAEVFYAGPIAESIADGGAGLINWVTQAKGPTGEIFWSWSSACSPTGAFEPGVDIPSTQARQRQNSAGFSLSAFTDQVRYMRQGIPPLGALSGSSIVYLMVQPGADGSVVQPQATSDWAAVAARSGVTLQKVPLDFPSGHVDYWGWPAAWNKIFREYLSPPAP